MTRSTRFADKELILFVPIRFI